MGGYNLAFEPCIPAICNHCGVQRVELIWVEVSPSLQDLATGKLAKHPPKPSGPATSAEFPSVSMTCDLSHQEPQPARPFDRLVFRSPATILRLSRCSPSHFRSIEQVMVVVRKHFIFVCCGLVVEIQIH